jgi:RimJ/RimL family protein N-acetyltransferase
VQQRHVLGGLGGTGTRGRGAGLALFSSWAFRAVGLEELWLRTHEENVASQRAAVRAGLRSADVWTRDVRGLALWAPMLIM